MCCLALISGAAKDAKGSLVSISTLPKNGPFYVGQTIQFTCETNTTRNISYQWNYNHRIYHSYTGTGQSINVTFDQGYLQYFWIFCTATASRVILGTTNKFVEIHGKLLESVCQIAILLLSFRMAAVYQSTVSNFHHKSNCNNEYLCIW